MESVFQKEKSSTDPSSSSADDKGEWDQRWAREQLLLTKNSFRI